MCAQNLHKILRGLTLGAGIFCVSGAEAQVVVVPRTVQADVVEKQAESVTALTPSVAIESAPALRVEIPPGAEEIHFVLKSVMLEGSTTYPAATLEDYYRDKLGQEITLADAYRIAAAITQRYHDDGFALAQAYLPEQKIDDGGLRIHVIEGRAAKVVWTGDELDSSVATGMADELLAMHPFSSRTLESVMLRLNELPSVGAKATIAPLKGEGEGAIEVQIAVERKHVKGQVSINNYNSRYLDSWQAIAQAEVAGIATPVDSISANLAGSFDPQFSRYARLEYALPVHHSGTVLKTGASASYSAPGFRLETLDVRSEGQSFWLGATQPIIRSRAEALTLDTQFSIRNQQTDILGVRFFEDHLRVLQFSGLYTVADGWDGANLINAELSRGINALGASETGTPNLSRANGHSDFTKLTVNASRLQALPEDFSLLAAFTGQWASTALLSSEQFGFGGPAFGRAYDSSEISGDDGVAASLELRYRYVPLDEDVRLQPFVYYDIGKVWNRGVSGVILSAASTGGGVRFQAFDRVQAEFTVAKPLTLNPSIPKLGASGSEPRYGVSLNIGF